MSTSATSAANAYASAAKLLGKATQQKASAKAMGDVAQQGGGVYATGGAKVVVKNDGDINDNTATGLPGSADNDGGGVYLRGGADLTVFDSSSHIGFGSQGNTADRGGGVFVAQGSTGSKVTIRDRGQVEGNSANFGAGVYLLNGELEVNDRGAVCLRLNAARRDVPGLNQASRQHHRDGG